jgi:hypothetical protein
MPALAAMRGVKLEVWHETALGDELVGTARSDLPLVSYIAASARAPGIQV